MGTRFPAIGSLKANCTCRRERPRSCGTAVADKRRLWQDGLIAKRPRDPHQLAKLVVDIAIGEAEDTVSKSKRHPSGRQASGKKGDPARAAALTPNKRRIIAQKAAELRITPAMAAGISDHVWSMEGIAMLTDPTYTPKKRGSYKKRVA